MEKQQFALKLSQSLSVLSCLCRALEEVNCKGKGSQLGLGWSLHAGEAEAPGLDPWLETAHLIAQTCGVSPRQRCSVLRLDTGGVGHVCVKASASASVPAAREAVRAARGPGGLLQWLQKGSPPLFMASPAASDVQGLTSMQACSAAECSDATVTTVIRLS